MSFCRSNVLVTVVFPCLNEEQAVGECIDEAFLALSRANIPGEVVVVDNNSTDSSVEIALLHKARVVSESQPGYGSALRAGIQAAYGEIVVMADADLTYELAAIPRLIAPIVSETADLVIGERLTSSTRQTMPFLHRRIGTPILSLLVNRAAGNINVRDSQSGFRAFRRKDVVALGMTATGMEFASEMLVRAGRAGFRICEIETKYNNRVGDSKLNTFSDGWRHFRQIILLAPHMLLLFPGIGLLLLGAAFQGLDFVSPTGIQVGSARWEPVFLAGIALVIGTQATLIGLVVRDRSYATSLISAGTGMVRQRWFRWVMPIGTFLVLTGGSIDVLLLLRPLVDLHPFILQEPLASIASSALINGISLVSLGVLYPLFDRAPMAALPLAVAVKAVHEVRGEDHADNLQR